jgi:flagellar protein FliO/FliZ
MNADTYWRFFIALVVVVALIFAVAWVARRLGLGGRLVAVGGKKRRLAIVEVLPLDGKRRLVLLRRDGMEHLVLLGLQTDLVVENGFHDPSGPAAEFAALVEGSRR